jgi:hypothetical protein
MPGRGSASRALVKDGWRGALQVISAVVAVEIALHSLIVKEPILTMIGAALWLGAGVFWTPRGGLGGPAVIGVLAVWELLASLFLSEEFADQAGIAPWILVVHVITVGAALVAAIMTIAADRRSTPRRTLALEDR